MYGEHRYRYDAWGNCTQKKSGKHVTRDFKWDANHRLTEAAVTNGEKTERWQYLYDPLGRRIEKRKVGEGGNTEEAAKFYWDGNRLLSEEEGKRCQLYLYEPDTFVPLAVVRSEVSGAPPKRNPQLLPANTPENVRADLARVEALFKKVKGETEPEPVKGEVFYIHADQIGTPKEVTDSSGNLVWRAEHKAWGRASVSYPKVPMTVVEGNAVRVVWEEQAEPVELNIRFQGQWFDEETGLHYNLFRYYDSDVGRFVSQDPIGLEGGVNLYRYAANPVNWIDPWGLDRLPIYDIGKSREDIARDYLREVFPEREGYVILEQKHLRDTTGKLVPDPNAVAPKGTGGTRIPDFVVVDSDGTGLAVEVTGNNVDKKKQLEKERRIRSAGGTCIKHGKNVIPVSASEVLKFA